MIFNQSEAGTKVVTIRKELTDVFLRDWNSQYTHTIEGIEAMID